MDACSESHCILGYDRRPIARVYVNGVLTPGAHAIIARQELATVAEVTLPGHLADGRDEVLILAQAINHAAERSRAKLQAGHAVRGWSDVDRRRQRLCRRIAEEVIRVINEVD